MKRFISLLPLAVAIAVLTSSAPAQAASLESAIDSIANRIEAYLKEKKQPRLNIREFQGPPNSSSGKKLTKLLADNLKGRDIEVSSFSNWEVRGDFVVEVDGGSAVAKIRTQLVNQTGAEIASFESDRIIDSFKDVLDLAQPTSFDGESPNLEPSETTADPPQTASSSGAASTSDPASSDAEQSVVQASGSEPATPPVADQGDSGSDQPVEDSAVASSGDTAEDRPVAGTPPTGDTPPVAATTAGENTQLTATGALPGRSERNARLVKSILGNQSFFSVNPTTIAASASSPYHVQIRVRRAGSSIFEPVDIQRVRNGLAVCDVREGDQYKVIITNNSPLDVGVELMIDGINSMHFSENLEMKQTGKWAIRGTKKNGGVPFAGGIEGWYSNPGRKYAFLVTAEQNSAAVQLGLAPPSRIGTITATFYAAWEDPNEIHPLEKQLLAELGITKIKGDGVGTEAPSPETEIDSQSRTVHRFFGRFPLASVSVRYENPEPPEDLPIDNAP